MMNSFRPMEYFKPKGVEEAVKLLGSFGKKVKAIAGCTDVMIEKPIGIECLVDLTQLQLRYVEKDNGGIRIGALTKISELVESPALVQDPYSVVMEAAKSIGSLNIRNMATLGGNLCHGVPSADMPPPLIALDAQAKIIGPEGYKTVALKDFFTGVKQTVLKHDELLTEVSIPTVPDNTGAAFLKMGRTAVDIALVNVAVRLTLGDDGSCKEARIVLGAVAPTPIRARKAEAVLEGKKIKEALIEEAAQVATNEIHPIDDFRASAEYRRELSRTLVMDSLKQAFEKIG